MTIDLQTSPKGREDVLFRQLDDEWVIYDPTADEIHVLNPAAAIVWVHATGEASVAGIARALQETFGDQLEETAARQDTMRAIEQFAAKGLLV
ncbi:MAG: PqqD family protein [Gemmatimonadetes bacterium]|nr:PqqD family protein [Gemmatimonadota bacterium]